VVGHELLHRRAAIQQRAYVLLTIYWTDEDKRWQAVRETLRIELARPILNAGPC